MLPLLLQAANNLIVLGREEAGAERIFQNNGVALLMQLLDTKRPELMLAAVRTLSGMSSSHRARVRAGAGFVEQRAASLRTGHCPVGWAWLAWIDPDTTSRAAPLNLGCVVPDSTETDPLVCSFELRIDLTKQRIRASLVAQMVRNLPAMPATQAQSLTWDDPLENRMATHSSILAWRIP